MVNGGVQKFGWSFPPPIQVTPRQRTPVVPIDYAVRVKHGNYFENKVVSEQFSFLIIWVRQEVYQSAHHPGADSFTWVDSSSK